MPIHSVAEAREEEDSHNAHCQADCIKQRKALAAQAQPEQHKQRVERTEHHGQRRIEALERVEEGQRVEAGQQPGLHAFFEAVPVDAQQRGCAQCQQRAQQRSGQPEAQHQQQRRVHAAAHYAARHNRARA